MAKKRNKPLTRKEKSKIDEELGRKGLSPWLPVSPDQLPERLRQQSNAIPTGKPSTEEPKPGARKPPPRRRKK